MGEKAPASSTHLFPFLTSSEHSAFARKDYKESKFSSFLATNYLVAVSCPSLRKGLPELLNTARQKCDRVTGIHRRRGEEDRCAPPRLIRTLGEVQVVML